MLPASEKEINEKISYAVALVNHIVRLVDHQQDHALKHDAAGVAKRDKIRMRKLVKAVHALQEARGE